MTDWHYIEIPVVAKQRARLGRRRKAFTPPQTVAFETAVENWWRDNSQHFGDGPVAVDIEIDREGFYVRVTPLEVSHRPVGIRGDIDNYVKSIFDGLNTAAWKDDKQVEWMEVRFVGEPRKKVVKNV